MQPDFSVIAAIAETGTFSGAAKRLGVAHTTVARKLRELEEHFGAKLIDRAGEGAVLTDEGEAVRAAATRIEAELHDLGRQIHGRDNALTGAVTLTTVDILAWRYMDAFARFSRQNPEIELTILTETEVRSLSRREAEMALRLTNAPDQHLIGRQVDQFNFSPYVATSLVEELGSDACFEGPWLSYASRDCASLAAPWMKARKVATRMSGIVSTPLVMLQAVTAGMGVGLLPREIADANPALARLTDDTAFSIGVWLLYPAELRRLARIKAVSDMFRTTAAPA